MNFNRRANELRNRMDLSADKDYNEIAYEEKAPTWSGGEITEYTLLQTYTKICRVIDNKVYLSLGYRNLEEDDIYKHYIFDLESKETGQIRTSSSDNIFSTTVSPSTQQPIDKIQQASYFQGWRSTTTQRHVYHAGKFYCFQDEEKYVRCDRDRYFNPRYWTPPSFFMYQGTPYFWVVIGNNTEIYHAKSLEKMTSLPFELYDIYGGNRSLYCLDKLAKMYVFTFEVSQPIRASCWGAC